MTLAVEDVTNYSDPGRHQSERTFLVGECSLSSRRSGMRVSWSLVCLNKSMHWQKGDWPRCPPPAEVERLVTKHMAECEYRSVD